MATEQIPRLDKMIKELGNKISRITGEKQRDVEEEILRVGKLFEIEEIRRLKATALCADRCRRQAIQMDCCIKSHK